MKKYSVLYKNMETNKYVMLSDMTYAMAKKTATKVKKDRRHFSVQIRVLTVGAASMLLEYA